MHGDRKKRKVAEKERSRHAPPSQGRCVLCKVLNPKGWQCPDSPTGGHIVLGNEGR